MLTAAFLAAANSSQKRRAVAWNSVSDNFFSSRAVKYASCSLCHMLSRRLISPICLSTVLIAAVSEEFI
jgi:hypothetical protein